MKRWVVVSLTLGAALGSYTPRAEACGCLALPSPATPVVQAGERILFAHENGQVVAYIQVQYQGNAEEFGWLVPLPSVPTLELGTDEVFTQLGATTQPTYQLTTVNACRGGSSTSSVGLIGCGAASSNAGNFGGGLSDFGAGSDMGASPVVIEASVGPFNYAVLKADNQSEMLAWLQANRYFVPAGTDQAMTPYIRPGAYFLALKLKSGQTTGDITPIVVRYSSDLPMIPIILTQVGAVPDMGILVWMLGRARAIPRNYHHTVLNDMGVWLGEASYARWVVKAIKEAPQRHAFITEYAGTSAVMQGVLDPVGRFGKLATLRGLTSAELYLSYLRSNGYRFDSTLYAILERHLPMPADVKASGVTREVFYANYGAFVSNSADPDGGLAAPFNPVALTDEIEMRIVVPTRKTAQLFRDHPYLTRLYTALSPADMTADPVFSENPDLPDVGLVKRATVTLPCNGRAWIRTDDKLEAEYVFPAGGGAASPMPASLRIEALREAGPPEVLTDNGPAIKTALGPVDHGGADPNAGSNSGGGGGCACNVNGVPLGNLAPLFFILGPAGALALRGVRRRKR